MFQTEEIRLYAEMLARYTPAIEATSGEILGIIRRARAAGKAEARRILRLQALDKLTKRDQETVLSTIDSFLAKAS